MSFFSYCNNIAKLSSQPDFNKHEIISEYCRDHQKIIFDINAKDVSEEEYQQTIDSLVSILQEAINLSIEKELVVCTSQGINKFSVHLIFLCFVSRHTQDLEHLYKLVEERMPQHLYKHFDTNIPKDGQVVTDKEYMNDLSKTTNIQCILL